MYPFLLVISGLILYTIPGISQEYIRNGSFEGFVPQENNVPQFWDVCRSRSTPDIQPITSNKAASEGSTYMGLSKKGANPKDTTLTYFAEAIGQEIKPLTPGFEYLITVHLSHDPNHRSSEGELEAPGKLNVYIGDGQCFDTIRIWQSPIIDHEDWKVYERNYIASCFNNYIILEADHGDVLAKDAAYVMVDNVSLIPVNNESALDTTNCGTEIEMPDTTVVSIDRPCKLYIPNAITPNHDGLHDHLEIFVDCNLTQFDLSIYNRWGNRVFHTEDHHFKWIPSRNDHGPFLYHLRAFFRDEDGEQRVENRSDLIYIIP